MRTVMDSVRKYVLKRRHLVRYDEVANVTGGWKVDVLSLAEAARLARAVAVSEGYLEFIRYRQARRLSAWQIFVVVVDGKIAAYSSLHVGQRESVWLDSLPTQSGEARESGTYVEPAFRGRGLRHALLAAQSEYCTARGLELWAVIEASNRPSVSSSLRAGGSIAASNYLLKLAGINVLSIVDRPFQIHLMTSAKRRK